jgi:hypothetical protein
MSNRDQSRGHGVPAILPGRYVSPTVPKERESYRCTEVAKACNGGRAQKKASSTSRRHSLPLQGSLRLEMRSNLASTPSSCVFRTAPRGYTAAPGGGGARAMPGPSSIPPSRGQVYRADIEPFLGRAERFSRLEERGLVALVAVREERDAPASTNIALASTRSKWLSRPRCRTVLGTLGIRTAPGTSRCSETAARVT